MIKIGDKTLATRWPNDLDAQLLAVTGCNAAEVQQQLRGHPSAGHVARVLKPFLTGDDQPDVHSLTQMIVAAGVADVAGSVAELYAAGPAADAADAEG